MNHFGIQGAMAPSFFIGDRVIATINDPDEGLFQDPGTVTGMVWLGTHWEYFLLFDGYEYSDCGWSDGELVPITRFSCKSKNPRILTRRVLVPTRTVTGR